MARSIMNTSTITGIITAIAVSIPVLAGILAWGWRVNGNIRPWKIIFSEKRRDDIKKDSDMEKSLQVGLGESEMLLRIYTKRSSDLTWISIRPMQSKWRFWHSNFEEDMPLVLLDILEVEKPIGHRWSVNQDGVGGIEIQFTPSYLVDEGFRRCLRLKLKACRKCKGVIQVSSVVKGKRRYVYPKFKIS